MKCLFALLILIISAPAVAAPPTIRPFEEQSGGYVAYYSAGADGTPKLQIFADDRKTGDLVWEAKLPQTCTKYDLTVSPNGEYFCIVDRDLVPSTNRNTLVLLTRAGVNATFSLEQLASQTLEQIQKAGVDDTTSGGRERRTATFFDLSAKQHRLVLHLWWSKQYVAIDCETGTLVAQNPELLEHLEKAGREHAMKNLTTTLEEVTAFEILRRPANEREGRKAIEALLSHPSYGSAGFVSPDGFPPTTKTGRFMAGSYVREKAAQCLMEWDNRWPGPSPYFARVNVDVHFASPLRKGDRSTVNYYLVPADRSAENWDKPELPFYRLQLDTDSRIRSKNIEDGMDVQRMGFSQVVPGRYWLKVVYDIAPPHNPVANAGDFENDKGEIVEVIAGRKIQLGPIECSTPAH